VCRLPANRRLAPLPRSLLPTPPPAPPDPPPRPYPPLSPAGRPAHDGGVAVGGQRDGGALRGVSKSAGADQLIALLAPHPAAAGKHPHRAGAIVVLRSADNGGVTVGGQRDRNALGLRGTVCAGPRSALLRPQTHPAGRTPG